MDTQTHTTELAEEMRRLRKGRGIHRPRLDEQLGAGLKTAFGITDEDTYTDTQRKVAQGLARLAATLPDDLRLCVLAAFGLTSEAGQQFYQERLQWVGQRLQRDERTIRRRVDEGISQLAVLANAEITRRPDCVDESMHGWHSESLRTVLKLDGRAPEAFEWRRIVADQDGLSEIDLSVSLTAPAGTGPAEAELAMDVLYGGALVRSKMESAQRFGMVLALPRSLDHGESHEFGLRFTVPSGQQLRPHFVAVVAQPCDLLDIRVKFDQAATPGLAWRLTKVFKDELDDPVHRSDPIAVNPAAELQAEFTHLTPGFAYGMQWD
ncbi:MAG TPA: hypothetical protein VFX16_32570 [Pseudonocardiaceae bacterium]|nr:hypothetical protein [Pseudonocardiaceae bacterium]